MVEYLAALAHDQLVEERMNQPKLEIFTSHRISDFRKAEYEALRTEIITHINAADRVCYFVVGANAVIASWLLARPHITHDARWLPLAVTAAALLFWASKARNTVSIGKYIRRIEESQISIDGLSGWESAIKPWYDKPYYFDKLGLYVFWTANLIAAGLFRYWPSINIR